MAKATDRNPASRAVLPIGFEEIQNGEIDAINLRRRRNGRDELPHARRAGAGAIEDREVHETVGLALSGGGIRSAAVALGVLQAFDERGTLKNIDYLSTVSGGGYIGSSLSATMSVTGGQFVYANEASGHSQGKPLAFEVMDTPAVGHIRNYSNYLIPDGMRDVISGLAIVLRGLVANFFTVFPFVLLLAAITVQSNPNRSSLRVPDLFGFEHISIFGFDIPTLLPVQNFGLTLLLALAGLIGFFFWALWRSIVHGGDESEFRGKATFIASIYLVLLAAAAFIELQPFVIAGMFDIAEGGGLFSFLTRWVTTLAAIATPIAALVTIFRQQFGEIIKKGEASSGILKQLAALGGKAMVWVAGAALPLLIWVAFLYLCYWGIINDDAKTAPAAADRGGISRQLQPDAGQQPKDLSVRACVYNDPPGSPAFEKYRPKGNVSGDHTPHWLLAVAAQLSNTVFGCTIRRPMAFLYICLAFLGWFFSLFLSPNANSLHRLYRDRLSKAFLFDPTDRLRQTIVRNQASIDQGREFKPLDTMKLSRISAADAPYHLINAALNIQGSDYANRRGRNADFFLFSPRFVGSEATDYARTPDMESACPNLDLATAMAVSGAAVSSNMGSQSIKPLTPTFALLNVRLGYWLKNPRYAARPRMAGLAGVAERSRSLLNSLPGWFLWQEITGRLYENSDQVYLTDGGHIENLGLYELLRRRCRVIVVVDVEADENMHFGSFIKLQRYARIDLGIRIDMPWDKIRETTLAQMKADAADREASQPRVSAGPHTAIGTINYGGDQRGYIFYIKSSLTGDETDYIRDYARRYRSFPHETTGDQFFSEEQFEVYRALGFHIAYGALSGEHKIEVAGRKELLTFKSQASRELNAVRKALA
jgi:predicted acylesterase/phospholipase RssA